MASPSAEAAITANTPQTFEVLLSTPRAPARICSSVPYPDGVTAIVRVEKAGNGSCMTVQSTPDHPAGFFDGFVAFFKSDQLETIPRGDYIFTAIIEFGTCKICQCPDSDLAEQRALWLRHRIQGKLHELARLIVSQREKAALAGTPRLTLLPGGKSSS